VDNCWKQKGTVFQKQKSKENPAVLDEPGKESRDKKKPQRIGALVSNIIFQLSS